MTGLYRLPNGLMLFGGIAAVVGFFAGKLLPLGAFPWPVVVIMGVWLVAVGLLTSMFISFFSPRTYVVAIPRRSPTSSTTRD